MMIKKNLGTRINTIRKKKNVSQIELSELSGLSESYISRIIGGSRPNISVNKLKSLADSLDVSVIDLLYDSNEELEMSSIFERRNLLFEGHKVDDEIMEIIYVILQKGIYLIDDTLLDYESEMPLKLQIESF